jgi:hypothetical protein
MSRHGDDVAPVRERRGTTPLAHSPVRRSTVGDDGPTRSVLLGWISCSSEGSPVMAGSVPFKVKFSGHRNSDRRWLVVRAISADHRKSSAEQWHTRGMSRIRLSTTVDAALLGSARSVWSGITDAALIDEALKALLARHRSAEVDASYAAYDAHPAEEPDEWGDLASWRRAASAT